MHPNSDLLKNYGRDFVLNRFIANAASNLVNFILNHLAFGRRNYKNHLEAYDRLDSGFIIGDGFTGIRERK